MSTLPECFANSIGLSRTDDSCVDFDVTASLSGLYVDELPGMSLRILNATDNSTTLLEKMTRARENAVNTFKVDLTQEVLKYKEPIRDRFTGDIGYKQFKTLVSGTHTYYGLRMYSDVRGGSFTLRSITIILNTTEALNLFIYDEYDLLYTIPITSPVISQSVVHAVVVTSHLVCHSRLIVLFFFPVISEKFTCWFSRTALAASTSAIKSMLAIGSTHSLSIIA